MHGVNIEGLLDVAAATAALAVRVLHSDNENHRHSAWKFLEEAGLLERVHERLTIETIPQTYVLEDHNHAPTI